jgi:hypothetical protein
MAVADTKDTDVEQAHAQPVQRGVTAHVVPSDQFANVMLDDAFTGAASRGAHGLYFSQLDNLQTAILLSGSYTPDPVRGRVVFITVTSRELGAWPVAVAAEPTVEVIKAPVVGHAVSAALPAALGAITPASRAATADPVPGLSLADVTQDLRRLADLPVQDIARMCGVGRRQYYNLMRGTAETMKTAQAEQHIRLLHCYLQELSQELGDDASTVRSAVLLPLDAFERRSFHDVAAAGNDEELKRAYEVLSTELAAGRGVPDRLSPSGTFAPSEEAWRGAADYSRADRRGR